MTHIKSHGLIRPPQNPLPPCPGAPSLVPGHSVLEDGFLGPGRQAWAQPSTHLSVFALRVKPPGGGLRMRRVSFFLYLYVIFMNGLHSGQGRGAAAPILPADARGLGCPGSLSPPLNPAPPGLRLLGASGHASQRPVPSREPQAPPSLCCQLTPVYAKASAATPPQGPAPLAAAFVTSLHAAPTHLPSLPGAARSLSLLVSPKPTIEQ